MNLERSVLLARPAASTEILGEEAQVADMMIALVRLVMANVMWSDAMGYFDYFDAWLERRLQEEKAAFDRMHQARYEMALERLQLDRPVVVFKSVSSQAKEKIRFNDEEDSIEDDEWLRRKRNDEMLAAYSTTF